jgi:DNA replication protein DnaC
MAEIYQKQREFRRLEWERSLNQAARFRGASISQLREQQDPYGAVSGWLDSGTLTLLLHGLSRTGKTDAAYAVGNAAHEAGLWVTGWHVLDLLAELLPIDLERDAARRIWGSVTSAGVLILDDFGTESRSAWTIEQVIRLLDTRSHNCLRTVVTTNLNEHQLSGALRPADRVPADRVRVERPGQRRRHPARPESRTGAPGRRDRRRRAGARCPAQPSMMGH